MPAYCIDCGTYVATGNRCAQHSTAAQRRVTMRTSVYRDARWKHARQVALANADHRCEECGRAASPSVKLSVHHAAGYTNPFDPSTLEVLCVRCHGRRDGAKARRVA